jgi:hypothetical protein
MQNPIFEDENGQDEEVRENIFTALKEAGVLPK